MDNERVFAFVDESGAFGWDLDNPGTSTHFIISAIIVKECDLESYRQGAEVIRNRYFPAGEIKSSRVSESKYSRRLSILKDIASLPMLIFSVCIDKRGCMENMNAQGLQYKKSFYKFMNNIVHQELEQAFSKITIVADETGSTDYMESFCRYFEKRQDQANLFGEANLQFAESVHDVRIQIADFISGTLARIYDTRSKSVHAKEYYDAILQKIIRIEQYPKTFSNYNLSASPIANAYDREVAELCYNRAVTFINNHQKDSDPYVKAQIIVLKYLLFRFMNNDKRGYIFTQELQKQISASGVGSLSVQVFRTKVIGKLRDKDVIIASSRNGYKIPSKVSDLRDYLNYEAKIVLPMLSRLRKCRNLVKLNTMNSLDLLDNTEFVNFKKYFDELPDFEEE